MKGYCKTAGSAWKRVRAKTIQVESTDSTRSYLLSDKTMVWVWQSRDNTGCKWQRAKNVRWLGLLQIGVWHDRVHTQQGFPSLAKNFSKEHPKIVLSRDIPFTIWITHDTSHSTLIHQKKTIHRCFLLSVHNTYSASCYGNHIRSTSVAVRQITMIVATQVYGFFVSICVSPPIKMKCNWVLWAYITEVQRQSNGWMSITGVDYWSGLLDWPFLH